jgi:hypothetical protein
MLVFGLAGCSRSGPSSTPFAASPVAADERLSVIPVEAGYVLDSAFRAVPGATVEIVRGPQAGASMTTDATGRFALTGAFTRTDTFTASKDGYVATTQGFSTSSPGGTPWLHFHLKPVAEPVDIVGDYILTFEADRACTDIPSEVRTRTYAASITPGSYPTSPAETYFDLTVRDAPVIDKYNGFGIGVAGRSLGFWLHGGHDAPLVERIGAQGYLAYSGWAEATVDAPAMRTIATSFTGWIEYCESGPLPGSTQTCRGGGAFAHCESTNHRLILTRR